MISVRHLSKTYHNPDGTSLQVLKDVNCEIGKGEIISIIGPSGTGKSTFLRALNLLDRPTGGEIIIDGENILRKGYPAHLLRQKMGMVFQSFNLFPHMTVLENISLAPVKLLGMSKADADEKAMELLRTVGLAGKADVYPDSLSGGQKQRVAIARCLAMRPEVILFDEPTSALDPSMTGEVLSVIRQLAQQGMTMLIVTHEMKFARDVSTRIFFMNEGVIWEDGSPEQIFLHPQRSATKAFVQQINKLLFEIGSPEEFDFYGMYSQMKAFCVKYDVAAKADAVVQIAEKMSLDVLEGHYPLTVRLSHAGISDETTLDFMLEGYSSSPLAEVPSGNAALAAVKGLSREIVEEPTTRGFRIKIFV
ncbi:MAG: amino acid ABC transporter ATP-binding protein [Bacteroidales bacterium]|nr:amino acid ABC transporter ATP-binding protein [Bacteroidales bacterium]